MIEETGTSRYKQTEELEITAMEASVSRKTVRRSREEDDTVSGTVKRRKYGDVDVNFDPNVVSKTESGASDRHVKSVLMCSVNDGSISDLKAERVSETDMFISSNDCFSRETSTSSTVVCFESEEMETSSSTVNNKKKKNLTVPVEATSRRTAVMMPSAAELEEFFSAAEKYEQKRFAEKYEQKRFAE
ncbi:hypothetical protein M8C21_032036, partial [Ambrosia artemisiifolia]